MLNGIGRFLPNASASALAQIRAEVATSVAAASSLAEQAQSVIPGAGPGSVVEHEAELAAARDDARHTTDDFLRDFYERRIFDPYLHFSSEEDERAYREREAQRQQAIADAKAQNTPQGDLRANELAQEQLKDAGAHGADHSPEYQPMLERLRQSNANLSAAISSSSAQEEHLAVIAAASPKNPDHAEPAASLKNAGVVVADQSQTGHGVTIDASLAAALGRC